MCLVGLPVKMNVLKVSEINMILLSEIHIQNLSTILYLIMITASVKC